MLSGKRERLRREASDWLARLQGPASEADRRSFEHWCKDPAHREAFDRVKASYGLAGSLGETDLGRSRSGLPRARRSRAPALAMAVAVAALVLAFGATLLGRPLGLMSPARAQTLFFATGVGEIREVTLPDGSRLTLDTATRVSVEIGGGMRQATLGEGRARFAVAADPDRPFIVHVAGARVTGRDMTLDLALIGAGATVHLIEGSASVEALAAPSGMAVARLDRGAVVQVSPGGDRLQAQSSGRLKALWPTGRLDFDATPLDQAIAEANRYSRTRISLADPRLSRLRVTGTFRAGDVEGLAQGLALAFDLGLERRTGQELVLRRPEDA